MLKCFTKAMFFNLNYESKYNLLTVIVGIGQNGYKTIPSVKRMKYKLSKQK